jgi:tetratricopeptide (TPR) repeat protein
MLVGGKYKLIQAIGEGGMGSVWLAEQKEPVKRKVAVKLVKAGMDSRQVLARFEAERQALAMMDHPNIAKVLDGGMTEQGRPYFVMELVKGIPLTEYCDQVQFSIRERLELFGQVCSAVQHAHQKGIIHRDLKPSNVLVTEVDGHPLVKVIDFGLAKALHGSQVLTDQSLHTAFGAVLGTPLYMAPEQLGTSALDVDTRADLYSLGVMLYEVLTGTTPIERQQLKQAAFEEMCRLIREQDPPSPSTRLSSSDTLPSLAVRRHAEPAKLTRLIRGELDWIVMKALEKDRNRRYQTANGLGLDIQCYLAGDAVQAAPPSRLYRLQKFWRRNRVGVVVVAGFLLLLVVGLAGTLYGLTQARQSAQQERLAKLDAEDNWHLAERQRARAEMERTRAEKEKQRAEEQREIAESQRTRAAKRETAAIAAVERFGSLISTNHQLAQSPELEPLRINLLQDQLQFFQNLNQAINAESNPNQEDRVRLASIALQMGKLNHALGKHQDAKIALEEAAQTTAILSNELPDHGVVLQISAQSLSSLAEVMFAVGDFDTAMARLEEAKRILEQLWQQNPQQIETLIGLAECWNTIGQIRSSEGKLPLALQAWEAGAKVFDSLPETLTETPEALGVVATCYVNAGNATRAMGEIASAIQFYDSASRKFQNLVSDHPQDAGYKANYGVTLLNVAALLTRVHQRDRAEETYQQAVEVLEHAVEQCPGIPGIKADLAGGYREIGNFYNTQNRGELALLRLQAAETLYVQLIKFDPSVSAYQAGLAETLKILSTLHLQLGNSDQAMESLERARAILEQLVQKNPSDSIALDRLASTENGIADLSQKQGDWNRTWQLTQDSLDSQRRLATENPDVYNFQYALANSYLASGSVLRRLGRDQEAIEYLQLAEQTYARIMEKLPDDGWTLDKTIDCLHLLIDIFRRTNQPQRAINLVNRQFRYQKHLNSLYPEEVDYQIQLANILHSRGDVLATLGNFESGLKDVRTGIELLQEIQRQHPERQSLQLDINNLRNTLGNLYRSAKQFEAAETVYLEVLDELERRLEQNPPEPVALIVLGGLLNNLALIAMNRQEHSAARDYLYRAIEYQQRALKIDPLNDDCRRYLKNHFDNLKISGQALQDQTAIAVAEEGLRELNATRPNIR